MTGALRLHGRASVSMALLGLLQRNETWETNGQEVGGTR